MAQRVLGIDLGAHAVKAAQLEVGFNSVKLISLETLAVPPGIGSALDRSLAQLSGLSQSSLSLDAVIVGMPGDQVLLRLLDIPAIDPRKLSAVVGNELADDLPWELEEVIFDQLALPAQWGKVLAGAARSAEVKTFLESLSALNLDPRALPIASLSYAGLVRRMDAAETVMVIDIGHLRTNLCLIQAGKVLAGRTFSRGGYHLTEAFRQLYQLSYVEAEALKIKEAVLISPHSTEASPADSNPYAMVTAQALAPLVRDIRLTLGLFITKFSLKPERILLCGGTSLVQGIDAYLTNELGIPSERINLSLCENLKQISLTSEGQVIGALSLGLAMEQGGRQSIDLRQGELAYHTDTSFIKDKILAIAISVVLVLLFAALNAYLSLNAMSKEEKKLTVQLKRATQMVFGEAELNPREVSRKVKRDSKAVNSGIPQKTAFDILNDLSANIPGGEKVKLDITRLDIKPGKTYITGTADSRSAVGDVVKALEKNKCFSKITTGTISDVSEGKKQFSLTISTDCL